MSEKTFKPGDRVEYKGPTRGHFGTILDVSGKDHNYVNVQWDTGVTYWRNASDLEHSPLSVNESPRDEKEEK